MTLLELQDRMTNWLQGEYQAVLFELDGQSVVMPCSARTPSMFTSGSFLLSQSAAAKASAVPQSSGCTRTYGSMLHGFASMYWWTITAASPSGDRSGFATIVLRWKWRVPANPPLQGDAHCVRAPERPNVR